jgi:hypothetical protein
MPFDRLTSADEVLTEKRQAARSNKKIDVDGHPKSEPWQADGKHILKLSSLPTVDTNPARVQASYYDTDYTGGTRKGTMLGGAHASTCVVI